MLEQTLFDSLPTERLLPAIATLHQAVRVQAETIAGLHDDGAFLKSSIADDTQHHAARGEFLELLMLASQPQGRRVAGIGIAEFSALTIEQTVKRGHKPFVCQSYKSAIDEGQDFRRCQSLAGYLDEGEAGHDRDHRGHRHDHHHDHDHAAPDVNRHDDRIRAFCFNHDKPVVWEALATWIDTLLLRHGAEAIRLRDGSAPVGWAEPLRAAWTTTGGGDADSGAQLQRAGIIAPR